MTFSIRQLKQAFRQDLPGVASHNLVMSYPRQSVDEILASDKYPRQSAVIYLLYRKEEAWHFLLLKRHDYKGVHSGQVGLPGGSLDEGETQLEAAVRELAEETGLQLPTTEMVTPLTPLYIPPSNFIVQPYCYVIDEEPSWQFDAYEVKRGMEIPLSDLLDVDSLQDSKVKMSGGDMQLKVKAFHFEGEQVWGATAMILSEVKEIIQTLAR